VFSLALPIAVAALVVAGAAIMSDVFYRDGSIYAAVGDEAMLVAAVALFATAVITLGLLRRERHGVGNIGVESVVALVLYAVALVLVL
jgi:cation:H+ antiporter